MVPLSHAQESQRVAVGQSLRSLRGRPSLKPYRDATVAECARSTRLADSCFVNLKTLNEGARKQSMPSKKVKKSSKKLTQKELKTLSGGVKKKTEKKTKKKIS